MGRSLGIDFGSKRVGIALSDKLNIIASPFKTLFYDNQKDLLSQLGGLINEYNIKTIVLGLPLNMSGIDSPQTKKIRDFTTKGCIVSSLDVFCWQSTGRCCNN